MVPWNNVEGYTSREGEQPDRMSTKREAIDR